MAYTKNPTWVDGEGFTLIEAAELNNIEDGIAAAHALADAAALVRVASGYWHTSPYLTPASTAGLVAANIAWSAPFRFPVDASVTAIGFEVTGVAAGTSPVYRIGLYLSDGTDGLPGTLFEQTTVAADSIGVKTWTLSTPRAITAGALIWVAFALQGVGAGSSRMRMGQSVGGLMPTHANGASWLAEARYTGCRFTSTGAFTSNPGATVSADDAMRFPYPAVRISL